MMGPDKNQEVMAAILTSIDAGAARVKEKRALWKAAFAKAEEAYFASFEAKLQSAFGFMLLDGEKRAAFKCAFEVLYEDVASGRAGWAERTEALPDFLNDAGKSCVESICQRVEDAPEDSALIRELQEGKNQQAMVRRVYGENRNYFLGYARNQFPKADLDAVTGVYQEAWIVILQYLESQKFRIVKDRDGREWLLGLRNKARIKTLLTAIGANMLRKEADDREISTPDIDPHIPDAAGDGKGIFSEAHQVLLHQALDKLRDKCRFLLQCRYWLKFSYREIREWTDAPSEEALRTQISRCMDSLKDIFLDMQEDL